MIEIRIPKEINEYKEKIFLGLTLRQILSVAAMALINIPAYFMLSPLLGQDLTGWIIILNAAPIGVVGFVKIGGMQFEQFAKAFIITNFIYPQNRKYKTENIYEEIANEIQAEKDAEIHDEFLKAQNQEREHLQEEERERRRQLANAAKPEKAPKATTTYEKKIETKGKLTKADKLQRKLEKARERENKWKEKEFVGAHLREQNESEAEDNG